MKRRISHQRKCDTKRNTNHTSQVLVGPNSYCVERSDVDSNMADYVFNPFQEDQLLSLLIETHNHMFFLGEHDIRRFIYEYAELKGLIQSRLEVDAHNDVQICKRVTFKNQKILEEFKMIDNMMMPAKGIGVWVTQFLAKHYNIFGPMISRSPTSTNTYVDLFYERFEQTCKLVVESSPHRIFNTIEVKITSDAIIEKGCSESESRSVMPGFSAVAQICANAAGSYMVPTVILRKHQQIKRDGKWMKPKSFYEWFDKFIVFSKPTAKNPVLLLIHGEAAYMRSAEFFMKALENHVQLFCCSIHRSLDIQPLDVSFVPYLSATYFEIVKRWKQCHPGETLSKERGMNFFVEAFNKAKNGIDVDGFTASGIYPINKDVFKYYLSDFNECDDIIELIKPNKKNLVCSTLDHKQLIDLNAATLVIVDHNPKTGAIGETQMDQEHQEIEEFIDLTVKEPEEYDTCDIFYTDSQKTGEKQTTGQAELDNFNKEGSEGIATEVIEIDDDEIEENPWSVSPESHEGE